LVYVGIGKTLYALRKSDSQNQWAYAMPADIWYRSSPVISLETDNMVLIASEDGTVAKFSLEGSLMWQAKLPHASAQIYGAIMLGPDFDVYVPASNGVMYRLRAQDAQVTWMFRTWDPRAGGAAGQVSAGALSFDGSRLFFHDGASTLYAVDVITNAEAWRLSLPGKPTTDPVVTPSETVYLGITSPGPGGLPTHAVKAFNRSQELWSVAAASRVEFLATGENGNIYAATLNELIRIE
jgi:outer membrane protein assembly factor BamB